MDSFVIRVKCENRKGTGKQYTITLLPHFLHPYSRRLTENILKAADSYIKKTSKDYQQAAMEMHADNEKTFKLYWDRIRERVSKWQLVIATCIAELDQSPPNKREDINLKTIFLQWEYWNKLLDEYHIQYSRYGRKRMDTRKDAIRYILMICAQKGCGLGP